MSDTLGLLRLFTRQVASLWGTEVRPQIIQIKNAVLENPVHQKENNTKLQE